MARRVIRAARSAGLPPSLSDADIGSTNAPPMTGRSSPYLGVDDVGDDARHVVRPAAAQGQVDKPVRSLLRLALGECLVEGRRGDNVRQAVGAEQVAVASSRFPDRDVRLDVGTHAARAGSPTCAGDADASSAVNRPESTSDCTYVSSCVIWVR